MEDLQQRVAGQVTGLLAALQDVPGEPPIRPGDPLAVCLGGRAADGLPGLQLPLVLGEPFQPRQEVLVGVLVGEPRVVVA